MKSPAKRLEYSPRALRDLRSIAAHIARDNPRRAATFVDELMAKARMAGLRPRSFRTREELGGGLRSAVHGNYILFFRERPDIVRIERIMHGAREFGSIDFD